jgi:hypothetical protein
MIIGRERGRGGGETERAEVGLAEILNKNRSGSKICALLGYYAALSGSSVPTFRDNLSVSSSRVKKSPQR